ncbi:MAG: hypothetical protein KGD58_14605 [Candidatus Lokiarchaeota archaeon]|nr:hypothetical protein [Candidatus Lokiarchaeota archaeon]
MIPCTDITGVYSVENVLTMVETYKKNRKYPTNLLTKKMLVKDKRG